MEVSKGGTAKSMPATRSRRRAKPAVDVGERASGSIANAGAEPHAAAPASSDPEHSIRVLENRLAAQAWDIKGLTAQRDEALENYTALREELVALREELLALSRTRAIELREYADFRQDIERRMSAHGRIRERVLASAVAITDPTLADPALSGPAPLLVAELTLVTASGLFDELFYRSQPGLQIPHNADAVFHYVTTGERAGFVPNVLFQPDFYAWEARQAGFPVEESDFASRLGHYIAIGIPNGIRPSILVDREFCLAQTDEADTARFDPLFFYLHIGRFRDASPHPLFDVARYRGLRGPDLRADADAVADYFANGQRLGLSPHPLFDRDYYFDLYPDVRESGGDPYLHYLQHGDLEGRQPNPLFDTNYYRGRYGAQIPEGALALSHYVLHGSDQGLATHILFDAAYYYRLYPDVRESDSDALAHFMENGCYERRSPHPLFDSKYLLDRWPEITKHHRNPVVAFLGSRHRSSASPTPFFDVTFYLANHPEAAEWPQGPFLHYLQVGSVRGFNPHPLFHTQYYVARLREAGSDNIVEEPLTHFLLSDPRTSVSPHPLFDQELYLRKYPDVAADGGNPLMHFIMSGGTLAERRQPHLLFDISFYAKEYRDDLRPDANLLLDFMENGQQTGRRPHPLFDPAYYLAQDVDDPLEHDNPLVDYVLKGRRARRSPHPLFDAQYYELHTEVPEDWTATLLEHYCVNSRRVQLLPHPGIDSSYVLERLPHIANLGVNLLEFFLARAVSENIDPHPVFDTRSYLIAHREVQIARQNPLAHHVTTGGFAWWSEAWQPDQPESAAPPARSEAGRPRRRKAVVRAELPASRPLPSTSLALSAEFEEFAASTEYAVWGRWPDHERSRPVALYAAYVPDGMLTEMHRVSLGALKEAGCDIVFVNSTMTGAPMLAAALGDLADIVLCRAPGGRDIASWTLAAGLFYDRLVDASHVLFMNDSLVGPFDDLAGTWESLRTSEQPWWGVTDSHEGAYHVQTALFALRQEVIRSAAFAGFVGGYRFPTRRYDIVQQGELGIARALLEGGFTPSVLAPVERLRAQWLDAVPTQLEWFEALPDQLESLGLSGHLDADLARSLSRYARDWYLDITSMLSLGDRINPTLLLWENLLASGQFPFIKRDLVLFNPPKTPELVRLKLLAGAAWPRLKALLEPIVPEYPPGLHPVLRITSGYLRDE
jgi:Rhamnan synthesis protein F